MAIQYINLGSNELSGDGESIRSAFSKINNNFLEISTAIAETDPIFSTSTAASITATDVTKWNLTYNKLNDTIVSIGQQAGQTNQGTIAVAIGNGAGRINQGFTAIAIGRQAGQYNQGKTTVAIGYKAGENDQGDESIAIGNGAGLINQGESSIAIGNGAGSSSQPANSIIINATGLELNAVNSGTFVSPIRNADSNGIITNIVFYNTSTKELLVSTSTFSAQSIQNWDNAYNFSTFSEGKTLFVSTIGNNSNSGRNVGNPLRTIQYALLLSVPGDIIKISAGEYEEEFPLEIPPGVTIKGAGLRATEIKPTTSTNSLNGFLLNGQSTIEDLTIKDMFYDPLNDTGYAFSYSPTTVISSKSPYVQRVTVLNKGSNPTQSDPYGFLSGDAGRGAIIDGQYVSRNSLQSSMLFNEVTFIVPNSRAVIMTNGARSEFLNCFTYFADLAIEGRVGSEGRSNDGKTYIALQNITGTFGVGDTIDYYSSVGDLLASYPIESINNGSYVIDGNATGYATFSENRVSKSIISLGGALTTSTQAKFGSASLFLDGDGDYIRISENLIPALGNFTVEGWIYPTVTTGTNGIFYLNGYNNDYAGLKLELVESQLKLSCSTNGSAWDFEITTGTVTVSTWTHISVERLGANFIVHLNGEPIINTDVITSSTTLTVGSLNYIGSINDVNEFTGYVDEVRVSNIARYTTSSFSVASSPYVNDNNTVMLLHFNGTLLDDDGPIVQDIRSSGGATATRISRYDRSEFAAELRAFACANVYGNQGVKADGADVKLNLIAHNFGYIGTGFDLTNDRSAVIQANEIIELNGGKVFYDTVDQDGNYRIGDLFTVNFETGAVSFQGPSFDVSSLTGINFTDGSNTTIVNPTGIETGNLVLSGNSLVALTGGLTIDPGPNTDLTINGSTFISGGLTVDGKTAIFAPVPTSSVGSPGDSEGLIAFSATHIYRCTTTYDGVTNIWKRIAWSGDTW